MSHTIDHLFFCWSQFKKDKRKSEEILRFHRYLEDNIFDLQNALRKETYQHGAYKQFRVFEPKQREISRACVRDRLVHHVVYDNLSEVFDPIFIEHSFSCRKGKGTHLGVKTLQKMLRKVTLNGTQMGYVLRMDIYRFFDHVSHFHLKDMIRRRVKKGHILSLIFQIIDSFSHHKEEKYYFGLPLGNVTSQVFANIYLHELDHFVKHRLKKKHYLRFCDDLIFLSGNRAELEETREAVRDFLKKSLGLKIHPKKNSLKKITQGVDFLGYVVFLNRTVIRAKTKRRLKNRLKKGLDDFLDGKISRATMDQKLHSYLGILSHADERRLTLTLKNAYWVRENNSIYT